MNQSPQTTRERILDATGQILAREGAGGVTIGAVAREAGLSKGGLFHHFASKEQLIDALVERYVAQFDELIDAAGDHPGAATRAYLDWARASAARADPSALATLSAALVNPSALAALRDRYERWQQRLDDDGIPAEISATIRFAVDGIWLADALDLAPVRGAARAAILDRLAQLLPSDTSASSATRQT